MPISPPSTATRYICSMVPPLTRSALWSRWDAFRERPGRKLARASFCARRNREYGRWPLLPLERLCWGGQGRAPIRTAVVRLPPPEPDQLPPTCLAMLQLYDNLTARTTLFIGNPQLVPAVQ